MQLLTISGYKNIEDCIIGEQLVAYDINTGAVIVNELQNKQWFSADMFNDEYSASLQIIDIDGNLVFEKIPILDEQGNLVYEQIEIIDENGDIIHENGNQIFKDGDPVMSQPVLIKTKEHIFQEIYGDFSFIKINNTWTLFKNQSVWDNLRVVHASYLQIGDIIYNDKNEDIIISSIEDVVEDGWWRLTVSGDHSYISDDLTLHNASRYWSGGMTATSLNWNYATGGTNWGSASGVIDNASVPASTDDVTFDGAGLLGNTNSTISFIATILSLNITSGYTASMTHSADLNINGNITLSTGYTTLGTFGITSTSTSTITSNGRIWNRKMTFQGLPKTLVGDLSISGLFTSASSTTVNETTTEKLIISGGMTISQAITGTADIYLQGGTWSGNSALSNNLFLNGNSTISGAVTFSGSALTYISGTIITTGSTLTLGSTCTITSAGNSYNNITFNTTTTKTLIGDFIINGTLSNGAGTTINKTTSETITVAGGMTINAGLSGTADIIWIGGAWTQASTTYSIRNNTTIAGNVSLSGTPAYQSGIFTYQSGTFNPGTTPLQINGSCTMNTNGISFYRIVILGGVVTLTSNLTITNQLQTTGGTGTRGFNKTTSERVTTPSISIAGNMQNGNADIYLTNSSWTGDANNYILSQPLFIDGNASIGGNVSYAGTLTYVSGTVTTTGSTLRITGNTTINTSAITWNNVTSTTATKTITLTSNLSMSGLLSILNVTVINKTTTETVTTSGGIATTVNATLSGTSGIYVTGGSIVTDGSSVNNIGTISNNLYINGNVTISNGSFGFYFAGSLLTYQSGTITTTGSTLVITNSTPTLNTSGIVWNNITSNGTTKTITLTSNLSASGLLTISGATTLNKTTAERLTVANGLAVNSGLGGTADIYLTGGTWSGNGGFTSNLFLNGDITVSGTVRREGGTVKYLSGNINTYLSTLYPIFGTNTFDTAGMAWWNLNIGVGGGAGLNITSDLTILGDFQVNKTGGVSVNGANVIIYGSLSSSNSNGSSIFIFKNKSILQGSLQNPIIFDGNCTIQGNISLSRDVTYLSGIINTTNSIINIIGNSTWTNMHEMPLVKVNIGANTVTMNQFFIGTPSQICQISAISTNYTIVFQDTFEKIGRNVSISGATLSRPMQLLVINNAKFNTNRGTNALGIRYVNQSPNGFAKNKPSITDTMTVPALGLASDPNFIKQ